RPAARRTACRSACSSSASAARTTRCCRPPAGARRCCRRGLIATPETRQEACAPQATRPGRALAAAAQGRRAREVEGCEAPRRRRGALQGQARPGPRRLSPAPGLGRMRELYNAAPGQARALDDEALSASLAKTLKAKPKGAGWWIFGYGSLLWNPIFPVAESRPARIHGLHRGLSLRSLATRGTRERPGLVLALEPGGSCRGVVYRLPSPL